MTDAALHFVGKRLLRFIVCSILVLMVLYVQLARAAGTVTNCSAFDAGPGSLAPALSGGGTVMFSCSGTITVPQITINNTITIDAAGQTVVLDGGGENRIFYVGSTGNLTLKNLTLQNGTADNGGAIYNLGTLSVINLTLASNTAELGGGAIF